MLMGSGSMGSGSITTGPDGLFRETRLAWGLLFAFAGLFIFTTETVAESASPLHIEELMAHNRNSRADEAGDYEDYVVIRNRSSRTVDLGGMYLTDDFRVPRKWRFPDVTLLNGGERLVVWADEEPEEGGLHATFRLGFAGDEVYLFDGDSRGNVLIDAVEFGPQSPDAPFVPADHYEW